MSYISLFSRNYEFDDILEIYVNLCFITEHLCLFSFFNHFVFNVVQIFQVLPSLTCKKIFQTCLRRNLVFFQSLLQPLKVEKILVEDLSSRGPLKLTYVYNGIREKWSRIKWYTRSICTLLYINFDGLYIIMNSP